MQTDPGLRVRPAQTGDIDTIAPHRAAMFHDMGQVAPHERAPLTQATAAYLRTAMPAGDYLAWVAEEIAAGTIIGGAGAQLRPIMPRPGEGTSGLELGPEALVLNVYVEPAWRRRGVAIALMRTLLADLADRGIRRIVLHASDEGRQLYERLGFAQTSEMRLTAAAAER
jgi:GNAT superfamily N-acetyltransferase